MRVQLRREVAQSRRARGDPALRLLRVRARVRARAKARDGVRARVRGRVRVRGLVAHRALLEQRDASRERRDLLGVTCGCGCG